MEEIDDALSKGSANGGVAAVVDETPYLMTFLAKYCNKYTMIGPLSKTDGFAFAFPKRSPILPDISLAVLDMTREKVMTNIKNMWFKNESNCQGSSTPKEFSGSIGTDNFWVLFLIAGTASTLALIIFVVSFIYRHRHIFKQPADSRLSTWTKIQTMFKIFNEKDPNCRAFKCSQQPSAVEASPDHFYPQSPVIDNLSHANTHSAFSGEQHTSSTDQASPEIAPAATDVVVTIQAMQISTPSPSTAEENN